MSRSKGTRGFTLIEILLVLAILGIISAIAIPNYLGQRRRARVIGDAISNDQVLRMQLETRRADSGLYGPANQTYTWNNGVASHPDFLPGFTPQGNSRMNFTVVIGATGLTYVLTCTDPSIGAGVAAYQTNQNGEELARLH